MTNNNPTRINFPLDPANHPVNRLFSTLMQKIAEDMRAIPYLNRRCDNPSYCERRWTPHYRGKWNRVDDMSDDGTMIEKYYCGTHTAAARRRVAKKIQQWREANTEDTA